MFMWFSSAHRSPAGPAILTLFAIVIALLGDVTRAASQTPAVHNANNDPEAVKIVSETVRAYDRLGCYSDITTTNLNDAVFHIAANSKGDCRYEATLSKSSKQRLHLLALRSGQRYWRIVAMDQSHYYVSNAPEYVSALAAADCELYILLVKTWWQVGTESGLLNQLAGHEFTRVTNLALGPPEVMDGTVVDVISCDLFQQGYEFNYAPHVKLWIGRQDHMIRQVQSIQGSYVVTETHSNVSLAPPPDSLFQFSAPAGVEKGEIEHLNALEGETQRDYDPRLVVGSPSIPFSAVAVDGRRIASSQYAGDVLVLNFWSEEASGNLGSDLYELDSLYRSRHSKGLDIVVFSEDHDIQGLEYYLKHDAMAPPVVIDRDPRNYIPRVLSLYGINRDLFNIVIGRDGNIAALNLVGDALIAAIDRALAAH